MDTMLAILCVIIFVVICIMYCMLSCAFMIGTAVLGNLTCHGAPTFTEHAQVLDLNMR